jgi:predicted dehydrogenase
VATPVRLKALIVGSGWARHAAMTLAGRKDVEVVGVVGRGSSRTASLARELGAPAYESLSAAIAVRPPNVAVVAIDDTSNSHAVEQLLDAGADVLCAHPVARTAAEVQRLANLAAARGRIVSTDYTLRSCVETIAALEALASSGALMRLDIVYPGRLLAMALDLALLLGGASLAVSAFGGYPEEVSEQRARAPAAFPPTVVVEHVGGCVTTLVPCPHAETARAFSAIASCTGGRVEVHLPSGGARNVRIVRSGYAEVTELVAAAAEGADAKGAAVFGAAMRRLADAFIDAVIGQRQPPCSFEAEVAVRHAWQAVWRSVKGHGRVETRGFIP